VKFRVTTGVIRRKLVQFFKHFGHAGARASDEGRIMNMSKAKGYFLSGTAGIAIAPLMGMALAPAANAADLKLKAPPAPLPVAAPTWAGWYIGVSAGGASQHSEYSNPTVNAMVGTSPRTGCFENASSCSTGSILVRFFIILLLHISCTAAVLEIVDAFIAHESVLNPAKVDPDM
jgi:hypothetical protein